MNLKHGDLENLILNIVWDNSEFEENGLNVTQVQDCLNRLNTRQKWAYTTVKTILDRLTEKGLLLKTKNGKKFNYHYLLSREEMARKALKKIALEYFKDDFAQMTAFADKLLREEQNYIYVQNR